MTARTDHALLEAALDLTSTLDLKSALRSFVDQACRLTRAAYGALRVLDTWGATTLLIEHSEGPAGPTVPAEIIAMIPAKGHLRLDRGAAVEDSGLIADDDFIGVSVLVHEQVYGRLYLTGKPGGFTDSDVDVLTALAPAAGVAVENAHLYADARRTERWISASQSLTTTMLEGADEEEALELIARTVREVSRADTAIIVLPSVGDSWAAEIIDGYLADTLLGIVFPPEGRAMSVLHEGTGMIVDSMARAQTMRVPQLSAFGPALYAPLLSRGNTAGVLILLRRIGQPEFNGSELSLAESLASQAALALELASARHAEDLATLLDERDRIGRDLHDFAIQQLFATGMQLDAAKQEASGAISIPRPSTGRSTERSPPSTRPSGRSARSCTICASRIKRWRSSSASEERPPSPAPSWASRPRSSSPSTAPPSMRRRIRRGRRSSRSTRGSTSTWAMTSSPSCARACRTSHATRTPPRPPSPSMSSESARPDRSPSRSQTTVGESTRTGPGTPVWRI